MPLAKRKLIKQTHSFPWRAGNRFRLLIDSPAFYPRMLHAISSAQRCVLMEMYLFESGRVADRFIAALLAAAGRDIPVFLLLDDFGAHALSQADRRWLRHPNIHVRFYNPLHSYSRLANLYRVFRQHIVHSLYRDHRKLLLIDGELAFAGGAGIADEFDPPKASTRWRETMLEVQGPVVEDWQSVFSGGWNNNDPQELALPCLSPEAVVGGESGRVTVNEALRRKGLLRSLYQRIGDAEDYFWMATAYFLPSRQLRRRLEKAAVRGVDVRLLLPGPITDHPGIRYASHRYYARLLRQGVRIFEFQPRFMHAKMIVCDDWASIGSCNFDRWNTRWNLEANQEIESEQFAMALAEVFEQDFDSCIEISAAQWMKRNRLARLREWLFQQLGKVLLGISHVRRK